MRPHRPARRSRRRSGGRGSGRATCTSNDATIRPGRADMTSTRVDRNTASLTEWVMNSPAKPWLGNRRSSSSLSRSRVDLVEGAERLVEQEDVGLHRQRAGQRDPHAHAARQPAGHVALEPAAARPARWPRRRAVGARPWRRPWSSANSSTLRSARCATAAAWRPGTRSPAGSGRPRRDPPSAGQARCDAQQGRLAAARRAHDADELAPPDAERHLVERVGPVGEPCRRGRTSTTCAARRFVVCDRVVVGALPMLDNVGTTACRARVPSVNALCDGPVGTFATAGPLSA